MVREMCCTVGGCGGCLKCEEEVKGSIFLLGLQERHHMLMKGDMSMVVKVM